MREVFMIRQKRVRFSVFVLSAVAIWLMVYSLFMTERTMETVRASLGVFVRSVLPPLAVFSVCTKLLVKTNILRRINSERFHPFLNILGLSPGGLIAFLVGSFAGFPTGASMLAELCENGEIPKREAESLLPFCNQAGVAFLFGTVGNSMLHDADAGFIFFFAQTVTAWTCVCMTSGKRRGYEQNTKRKSPPETSLFFVFTSSVRESAFSMIGVCGFIVFFSLLGTALFDTLFSIGFVIGDRFRVLIGGILEISAGFGWLSECTASWETRMIFGGILLGWGGISVFMQVMERTEAVFFSPKEYLGGKLMSVLICPIFTVIFALLNERNDGKKLIIAVSLFLFCIFYLLNYVKLKFFSKKCGKIERNAV